MHSPPTTTRPLRLRAARGPLLALLLLALLPTQALAETWGIGTFQNRGVDPNAVATFRDLLRDEIGNRLGVTTVDVPGACDSVQCVRAAAAGSDASVVVHGSVGRLGQKVVVSVNAIFVDDGSGRFSQRMNAMGVEEFDVVAARMAEAMVSDRPVAETAELGNLTDAEVAPPKRRRGRFGGTLGLQGILPLSGYADEVGGAGIEGGMWFETYDIAIEPRLAVRFDMSDPKRDYLHGGFELGVSWLMSRSDISPVLGVGTGLHGVWESVERSSEGMPGFQVQLPSHSDRTDFALLFPVFLRAGVLLLRTYNASLLLSVDAIHSFGKFEDRGESGETAFRLNMQFIFGGA